MGVAVRTIQELEGLESGWRELFAKSGSNNPFESWDWTIRWVTSFARDGDLLVLADYDGATITAIAPLRLTGGTLSFLGDPMFADYAGILCLPGMEQAATAMLARTLQNQSWRRIDLAPVRAIEPFSQALASFFSAGKHHGVQEIICGNPRIDTGGSFQQYYSAPSKKKLRQEIRTTQNNLDRLGTWRYVTASSGPEAHRIFGALTQFHTRRQAGKVGTSIFDDSESTEFFRRLLDSPSTEFKIHLSGIELNGTLVSAAYSISCGDSFYYWIPSFDQTIPRVSLGKLHLKCLVEECFSEPYQWFDFMGGDESYKYQWSDSNYDLLRFVAHRSAIAATVYRQRSLWRQRLKDAKDRSRSLQWLWHKISKA
ncbi:hypothetical protein ASD04_12670 [Devosia sp. Root436]|uniref:GNAT family N-acetyltransferase n=1 Tax=Devosia sp. Root436 TaxID=1736537 RepID=UPI0006FB2990|nr:GNAT family N-acetyltransferase [Devosia sp. Root436]KQX35638.1 hypothetical protein ASD04_12670 [Devosia sp. Root436]